MEPNGFQNVDYQNEKETQQGFNSCTSSVTLAQVQMTSQMTSQCPQNLDYVDDEIFNELFPQKENQIGKSNLHLLKCLFAGRPKDKVLTILAPGQRIIHENNQYYISI